jgi:tripartite-type tricarboxylate transporter receptor subunit TctC
LAELTAKSKSQPGRLNYASNGQGTSLHLSAELYKSMADIFITHIPYRGAAAGLTGVISGEVNLMFDNLPSALGLIQSGKLRALAVTTQQRSNALPQVPTMDEAGLKGYQVSAWFGLVAPTGLPANVQTRLEQALQNVAQQADTKSSMVKVGAEPTWLNAQAMSQFMQSDYAQWKDVAQYAKITLD